ncbi:recombinase family protein [Aneurinibacillus sp. Ricciae_BoGa-3]|uniref:recombinase family protein n=1 Tax=Aneurinibacillus sp. Ricciae_BoGa-3 TaxID=3022697 RepID=UPI002340F240|nr:recombinase family protein [Aneurinibacillus sp. Ricciae_BoGa-3]WCK53566.1 recombinase family protein [Aneurinibacillus sp. Ricciae_BoGa-3]
MIGIYARVSTEEQARSGFSLESQVRECRKKAGTTECKDYVDDGVSGEFLDRPALARLRQDVRDGLIRKIVCLDPDRLSRKLMHQLLITEEFDRRGIELVFVSGDYARTPEGQLFYSMRGAIAEFEKAKINERMSRGRREKARQGRVLRDFQIYGYSYDKEKEQMIVKEDEAAIVRMIFNMFTKPGQVKGMNGIANHLTANSIPTKKGKGVWHRQVVRQILMNEAYIGEFYQNKWNTEGMLGNKHKSPDERVAMKERPREEWILIPCPPIVDQETFDHAQKLLQDSRRRWAKKGVYQYLLSGLVRCADCGNTLTGRRAKNWGKYEFEYTDIKNSVGAKERGCGRRLKAVDLETQVWETIRSWLEQPDEIAAAVEADTEREEIPYGQTELTRLEKEIEKAKEGRKRIVSLFAAGLDISEAEVRETMRDLKEKEEKYTKQLAELNSKMKESKQARFNQNLLNEAAEYYLTKRKDELTFDDKQQLIRQLAREIIVYEDHIEIFTY